MEFLFNTFPTFDLGDIVLRGLVDADAIVYQKYMTNPRVMEFLTSENVPSTYDSALNDVRYWGSLFHTRRSFYWAIALKDSNQLVGSIGFNIWNRSHNRAEISYDLDFDYWGRGLMNKSIQAVLDFGFYGMQLNRIQATVMLNNDRSIKLLERSGFMQEGILHGYEVVHGMYTDYYMYAKTRNELATHNQPHVI